MPGSGLNDVVCNPDHIPRHWSGHALGNGRKLHVGVCMDDSLDRDMGWSFQSF